VNEISTPIEPQTYSAGRGETVSAPAENSVFRGKTPKKDGLGIFAKILDGLVSRPKNGAAASGKTPGKGGAVLDTGNADADTGTTIEGKDVKKKEKSPPGGKKTALSGADTLEPALTNGEITAFLEGDAVNVLKDAAFLEGGGLDAGFLPEIPAGEGTETSLAGLSGPVPADAAAGKPAETGFPVFQALDEMVQDGVSAETVAAEDAGFDAAEKGGKNSRKGAVDFLQMPARDMESAVYQFSGTPRPALVDIMAGNRTENRETAKASDARGKKGRDRAYIEVKDFRTGETRSAAPAGTIQAPGPAGFQPEKIDVDIPVELGADSSRENSVTEAGARQDFGDALARELRDHLNTDIVRQAQVILRDRGEGVIRLSLRPENLGNVKVRLEMTENKITGHIVVESSEAFKAFERELPVLEKAFQDSGFSETSLDMSFAGDSSSFAGNFGSGQDGDFPRFSPFFAASRYDAEAEQRRDTSTGTVPELPPFAPVSQPGKTAVNLLV
jgi:hypothetical protein